MLLQNFEVNKVADFLYLEQKHSYFWGLAI